MRWVVSRIGTQSMRLNRPLIRPTVSSMPRWVSSYTFIPVLAATQANTSTTSA